MLNKLNKVAVFTSETGLACPISKETFTALSLNSIVEIFKAIKCTDA